MKKLTKLAVERAHAEKLYWLGSRQQGSDASILGALADMEVDTTMRLAPPLNHLWWAVPAILNDPLCANIVAEPLAGSYKLKAEKGH